MEINRGRHAGDLHRGFGFSALPKENVVPNQAAGGRETLKRRKEMHKAEHS